MPRGKKASVTAKSDAGTSRRGRKAASAPKETSAPTPRRGRRQPLADANIESSEDDVDATESAFDTLDCLDDALEAAADAYFNPARRKRTAADDSDDDEAKSTSEQSRPCLEDLRDWLQRADDHLPTGASELFERHRSQFARWRLYLCAGYNVLLHGYGSKLQLLDQFCAECLAKYDYAHLVVRGFLPDVTATHVIAAVAKALGVDAGAGGAVAQARALCEAAAASDKHVALVVHNIDGPALRDDSAQTALSLLAACPSVRLLASVDHVNAALLWDGAKEARFGWVRVDATTYRAYGAELLASNSKLLGLDGGAAGAAHTAASLENVWASLTHNARLVFVQLVRAVIAASAAQVGFWDLYRACRDEFLISGETALRQQITEFRDHNVVQMKVGADGAELVELLANLKMVCKFVRDQGVQLDDYEF